MSSLPLNNYLHSRRRHTPLTQDDLAHLLGLRRGSVISRYERLGRLPPLPTVLAYSLVFGATVPELFAGLNRKVQHQVWVRAKLLGRKYRRLPASPENQAKANFMQAIALRLGKQKTQP